MRIGINLTGTCRRNRSGCAQFTIRAVDALVNLNNRRADPDDLRFYCRLSRFRRRALCHRPDGARLHWFQDPVWPVRPRLDVVHGFGTHPPLWRGPALVATLFDVFSMLEDSGEWNSDRFRAAKETHYSRLAERCDLIIAASEATRCDFLRFFPYPPERILRIPGGVGPEFSPSLGTRGAETAGRYGVTSPYCLFVGSATPRKNVRRLVHAFNASGAGDTCVLAVAGSHTDESRAISAELASSGRTSRVVFMGYVPDADMPALYAGARAFLFPTLYEGFGMPVLEAMASGTPVLVSNTGAAPEIAGEHAVQVDPKDVDDIARGIRDILQTGAGLVAPALAHAATFTWERCAAATREAYERAAADRR
ncbi:MAG: glycosyltransferase family 4 protein [Lentisphaerae bacterium]|nr:glycosyltransferase family 4 protein [Lentisphaerota bacterium]